MKAILYEKGSSPDVLVLREIPQPVPADHEVLIKIIAVSINAADYRSMRMGIIPERKIFGADIAGRVEAVGRNTTVFSIGDEVFGDLGGFGFGGFAEYVAVCERPLALKPAGVSFEDAAAVPMAAVTALQSMRDYGNIQPGQKVLIYGAGGGVGTFAVQLAKVFGTEVTAVCGPGNVDLVRSLGADRVIDYTKEDFAAGGIQYDLILAINGNLSPSTYKRALAPKGTCVVAGGALPQVIKALVFQSIASIGSKKIKSASAKSSSKDLEWIISLVQEGKVRPVIDRHYPLEKTAEAVRYLSEGHARGKVVINVAQA